MDATRRAGLSSLESGKPDPRFILRRLLCNLPQETEEIGVLAQKRHPTDRPSGAR
jgi:hypothetical protein